MSTFQYGSSGRLRDRQWRARVDLYGAAGLTDRLQIALDVPLVHNRVQEIDGRGPCPTDGYEGDYCDPVTSAGEAGLRGRYALVPGALSLDLGARTDAWNAGTRGRWTNAGLGTTSLVAGLVGGGGWTAGGLPIDAAAWGRYRLTFGRTVDAGFGPTSLPGDSLHGGLEIAASPGPVRASLGASAMTRLAGVEYGPDYTGHYIATVDRWASLRYREIRGEAKLSVPLGEVSGLHVSAGRVIVARNGPRDALDVAIGAHRWFP